MNLKETIKGITNWAQTFPKERTDNMVLLTKLAVEKGWYLNEVFLFSILRDGQVDDLDCLLQECILDEWDEYWAMIIKMSPDREHILTEAKSAFDSEMYSAAIHLLFSQADGVFYDKFAKNLFTNRGDVAKLEFGGHLTDLISRDSWESLAEQYKDASIFRRMYNEVYKEGFSVKGTDLVKKTDSILNEENLMIPNRHGVLHGIHKNYGSKLNALKCFSLLLFVVYAIFGDEIYEDI
ncbi:hypothetical protein [Marinicellulosiphila megalodicopiae]|uniref:hypothetical protein n=1 Tax=Marinicellulosiphila megalodicopiae TaxID=2724896 RepID=UPI003BB0D65B